MNKVAKRINILLFYALLVIALGAVGYFMIKPDMSCTDGIKNQGEEGVDCGGPCAVCQQELEVLPLTVKSIERASDNKGSEDILIKIYNPNEEYGAKFFEYEIYDGVTDGGSRHVRNDFVLPMETKYIIVNKYIPESMGGKLKIVINSKSIEWEKIVSFEDPLLSVYNSEYKISKSGSSYANLIGLLVNRGSVDYETIKVKAILRDVKGKFLSGSYQIVNTLPAGAKREFNIPFPSDFSDRVVIKEVEVETNIFESENYLKMKGKSNYIDR